MDVFFLIGLLLIAFIGLPIGFTYLFYLIPKKLGHQKVGKILSSMFGLFVVTIFLLNIFEDDLFTKNDAKELLEEQNISLADKFDIESNVSHSAIGDYYHRFSLEISEEDKQKTIKEIQESENFKKLGLVVDDLLSGNINRYHGQKISQNYETENSYIREYFKPNNGYAPTFRRISVDKMSNKLTFEDIIE
jgi:hypothetical protein